MLPGMIATAASVDPWMTDVSYLDNAKIVDGPAVTLAYLVDDPAYRTPVEALFRSLTLTFLDNATSEYCFLARFFEGVDLSGGIGQGVGSSIVMSSSTSSSATKVKPGDTSNMDNSDDGPLPEESASVQGGDEDGEEEVASAGTVVALSEMEKRRLRGRGAIDGLWKQVMEPVVGTYNTFVTSILATQPSLLSLYTMLRLNDLVLQVTQDRGASSILQGTFMTFKLKAWPIVQKQFDEVVESVKKVKGDGLSGGYLGSFGGFFSGQAGIQAEKEAHDGILRLICARYARLYSSIVKLNSVGEEDVMIFGNLTRLQSEVEVLLSKAEATVAAGYYEVILTGLEQGPAGLIHSRIQSEISHWREAKRSRTGL
jgi:hypothetical protein